MLVRLQAECQTLAARLWMTLAALVLVVIVAVLIAVTLNPVVEWFERPGLPRWAASAVVVPIPVAAVGGFMWLTWTTLTHQVRYVAQHFRQSEGDLLGKLPRWVRNAAGIKNGDTMQSFVAPALGATADFHHGLLPERQCAATGPARAFGRFMSNTSGTSAMKTMPIS